MDVKFLQYCIETDVLTSTAVSDLMSQSNSSASGYELLVKMGAVSQEQLAVSAGEFYQCQVVDLSRVTPEPKATAYGNAADCRRFLFIPFAIEPAGSLLVALADYSLLQGAQMVLRSARVERMKFYIAPVNTLVNMLNTVYGSEEAASVSPRKRSMSILRTQYLDFDLAGLRKDSSSSESNASQSVDAKRLQAMSMELAACHEENALLKARLEQLFAAVELESGLIRDLARLLNSTGKLDSKTYETWLSNQR